MWRLLPRKTQVLIIGGMAIALAWAIEGAAGLLAGNAPLGAEADFAGRNDNLDWGRRDRQCNLAPRLEAISTYWAETVPRSHGHLGRRTCLDLDTLGDGSDR
jgi:hypothetical protein